MELADKVGKFLLMLEGFRSPKTARWYADKLQRFAAVARERWGVTEIEDLHQEHIVQFFRYLHQERGCSGETTRGYKCALRKFFRWVDTIPGLRGTSERLLAGLPSPQRSRKVPEAMSKAEIQTVLSTISDGRDRAIFATFLGTGIRAGELAALQVEDVDFAIGRILIHRAAFSRDRGPKGGRERLVRLPAVLKGVLADYLGRIRPRYSNGNSAPWLFLTRRGQQFSVEGLYRLVRRWLRRAGIRKRQMGPHLLRRTYASLLRAEGVSKSEIAVRLGHSDATGTQVVNASYISRYADQLALDHGPDPLEAAASLILARRRRQA